MNEQMWWRGAVIYQIYPRSFYDANQDGIGDLPGIISKLDYIASLGVDAIWISPFFKSPMKDFGYDISDYRKIDPIFGTLADFDELVIKAHAFGIKIMIDQVLSHTSDQHQWFIDSREDQTNDKADWYVWSDAKADGTAPNNWLSIFGGSGWTWQPRRQQYYLHNFLTSQPDLNFHNPDVRQAVLDNIEFWLKRGVDGFRLDAINFCYHDALLRDNPAKAKELRTNIGFDEKNPYAYQYHYYNNTQDENLGFMEDIRTLLDQYPGSVALGEISSEDSLKTMAEYTQGEHRLHMGYSFDLLTDNFSANYIKQVVQNLESRVLDGWPCWSISNHDVERV
ncbi:MAG: alpha-glucosidase, partial [Flavobacteriales bacterium]